MLSLSGRRVLQNAYDEPLDFHESADRTAHKAMRRRHADRKSVPSALMIYIQSLLPILPPSRCRPQ